MVADITGFSRLMERDETQTFARLRQLRDEIAYPKVAEHGGRIVKSTGDGFLAEFASVTAALRSALDIQRYMVAHEAGRSADTRIRLRIGINVGDIIIDGDDVAGDGVNIAARLETLAPPDGICISANVREQLHDELGATLTDLGEQRLKNIARPIRAFAVTLAGERGVPAEPSAATPPRVLADPPSIAVLPFINLSGGEENEYFADGLAEELLNVLAKIRGLRVASRTSAFFFKDKGVDIPTVAQKLNVATVLEGSVRRSGQRIRITTQLIDAATDSHLWSEAYDRTLDDILAVQADIAHAVVAKLRAALLGEHTNSGASAEATVEVQAATSGRTDDPEAYRLYLQGRFYVLRITEADVARGVGFYRQALERDPAFALAWSGLSRAYHAQAGRGWLAVAEGMEQARDAAQRALALAPNLAEGHIALTWVLADYDWDWRSAQSEVERALALAPGDGDVHRACASLAMQLGRAEESISARAPRGRARPVEQARPRRARRLLHASRPTRRGRRLASIRARPRAECRNHALLAVVRSTAAGACGRGAPRGRTRSDSLSATAVHGAGAAHDRRCVRLRCGVEATDRRSRRRRVVPDRGRVCMARRSRRGLRLAGARLRRSRSRAGRIRLVPAAALAARRPALAGAHAQNGIGIARAGTAPGIRGSSAEAVSGARQGIRTP